MDDERVVRRLLARAARRLWLWRLVRRGLRVAAGVSALGAAMLVARPLDRLPNLWDARLGVAAAAALGFLLLARLRPPTPALAARAVDTAYGLEERFTTAVECFGRPDAARRLVLRDAARWCAGLDLRRLPRAPVTGEAWAAAACVAVAAVLWFQPAAPSALPPLAPAIAGGRAAGPVDPRTGSPSAAAPSRGPAPGSGEVARGGLRAALGLDPERPPAPSNDVGSPKAPDRRGDVGGLPRHDERAGAQGRAGTPGTETVTVSPPVPAPARSTALEGGGAPLGAAATGSGGEGPGRTVPGTDGGARAAGAGAGDASAPSRGASTDSGRDGGPQPSTESGAAARPIFTRASVPPAVRQYILRYFRELRASSRGEN